MPRRLLWLVLAAALLGGFIGGAEPARAQGVSPDVEDTARLLGYLWADGKQDADGTWDLSGPSGANTLIEELVARHGGVWVDRQQLIFTLPAPYDWLDWKDGLPDDDAWVDNAVQSPHFLAALLEGEGSVAGLVYDQSSCCTDGFLQGRLTELHQLLLGRGYETATLTTFGDVDSGNVTIAGDDITELRQQVRFVCPASGGAVRIPGGEDFATHGNARWLGADTRWGAFVRQDCVPGEAIDPVGPPIGECVAHVDADRLMTLTWTFMRGDIAIRRDGAFLDRVSVLDERWTETVDPGTFDYTARGISDGQQTDINCGTIDTNNPNPPPPPAEPPAAPNGRCHGFAITIIGTEGADVIAGTAGNDVIAGLGGNDVIFGFGGNDVLCGGRGIDTLYGGDGRDRLWGDAGFDKLYGGQGRDRMAGNNGNDLMLGQSGIDVLYGSPGDDWLDGAGGDDLLFGQDGNDTLIGGRRDDVCDGGTGTNTFHATCETER